jgi:hypothetical protein
MRQLLGWGQEALITHPTRPPIRPTLIKITGAQLQQ